MILSLINVYFFSIITPAMLLIFGAIITLKLRSFYIFHPIKSIRLLLTKEKSTSTSPFSAMCLALAGTLGVGNIVGVASAIMIGGYGSIFWMWISALLAMSLKYAEILISMKYRKRTSDGFNGGAAYYIFEAFSRLHMPKIARIFSSAFVIFCVLNSLTMGCMLQSNAISSSFSHAFGLSPVNIGIVTAALFALAINFRSGKVERITGIIVPIMSVAFLLVCSIAIISRRQMLPDAFKSIVTNALSPRSVGGGMLGFIFSRAFRAGSMRGLISNEAGAGTAPTAHAMSDTRIPEKQGLMGVFEVFADTIIICTLTALVIILSGTDLNVNDPMTLIINAFSSFFGSFAEFFICISIFLFAFATLICWAKYGKLALAYLTRSKALNIVYTTTFTALIILGTLSAPSFIWDISDISIGVMTILNLCAIFILRKEITIPRFKK